MSSALATGGLFFAWLAHDIEELLTMSGDANRMLRKAPGWLPIPQEVRDRGVTQAQVNLAILMMGALFATASIDGYRTGGRSRLYQTLLEGLGLHTFSHLASAVVRRGYSSGVVTAPVTALPFWLWARRSLKRNGVDYRPARWALTLFVPLALSVHGLAYLATAPQQRPDR